MTVNPLNVALSGLRVAQAQIGIASNNIANVSTEGYTRKTLQQTTTVIGGEGAGVATGTIQRRINEILLRDYRSQLSLTAGLTTRANYMTQIQELHGPPDAQQSISAEVGKLKDAFAQLANQPESVFLLNSVYTQSQSLTQKLHDFSAKITAMRNNAQNEMAQSVGSINSLTEQIADLNRAIKVATTQLHSTADLEDQRDIAVRELAKELDISYFKDQTNVLVVMTRQGQLLVDTAAIPVNFSPVAVGAQSYYPTSANAVRLGSPTTGVDLTAEDTLGGRLGELIKLRDDDLPVYQAQMDELAHKMALRFESQGLKLFTSPDGTIPANNPTSYVGFSAAIVVNPAITLDKTLIREGTNPSSTVQDGSSEVLRKIIEFAFGNVEYQRALGDTDVSNAVPLLFTTLGITGEARVRGTANIQTLGSLDSSPFINPGVEDTFSIRVGVAPAQNIVITAGMTAATLVGAINTAYPGMASLSPQGELILVGTDDITIGAGTLGVAGLNELGLTAGVTAAVPPSFQIGLGNNNLTTITIEDTDTITQLLAKINAIAGLDASTQAGTGFLQIVPEEGGDITLIDGLNGPLAALGIVVSNVAHVAFNTANLGPGANLEGRVEGSPTLHDYATQAISLQSQDAQNNDIRLKSEDNYRAALEKQNMDSSGVNVDEEMAQLISIQTAYNASARTIRVAQEMMDELMNALR